VSPPTPMIRLMYVASVVRPETRCQLVDEDVLARLQGVLHRLLLDLERLRDEVLDDEKDDKGQDERLDDLEETAQGATAHKSGSIGASDVRRRRRRAAPVARRAALPARPRRTVPAAMRAMPSPRHRTVS